MTDRQIIAVASDPSLATKREGSLMKQYLSVLLVIIIALGVWFTIAELLSTGHFFPRSSNLGIPTLGGLGTPHATDAAREGHLAKSIDILVETSKLLMSWSIVLVAALGAILAKIVDSKRHVSHSNRLFAIAALAFAILSLLTGFSFLRILAILIATFGPLAAGGTINLLSIQFIMLFLAVVCGGAFFVTTVLFSSAPTNSRVESSHSLEPAPAPAPGTSAAEQPLRPCTDQTKGQREDVTF